MAEIIFPDLPLQNFEKIWFQRALADKMQLEGIALDKNAIQRIESGQRFVTDIELKTFAKVLGVSCDTLLS